MGVSRRFEGLIFDLGYTLIRSLRPWGPVFNQANAALLAELQQNGFDLGDDFISKFVTRMEAYYIEREETLVEVTSLKVLLDLLREQGIPDPDGSSARKALSALYRVTQKNWQVEKDAVETLSTLVSQGYRLGLVSNAADDVDVQALVAQAGIGSYFDFVLTSARVGYRKPHRSIFNKALGHWNIPAKKVAMIGDTLNADILGANRLGIFSIWISRRARPDDNSGLTEELQPNAEIASLAELPALLSALQEDVQ